MRDYLVHHAYHCAVWTGGWCCTCGVFAKTTTTTDSVPDAAVDAIALRQRIAELEAERDALRAEVERLREALAIRQKLLCEAASALTEQHEGLVGQICDALEDKA